jgi:lysophospholipase L1-like esterase
VSFDFIFVYFYFYFFEGGDGWIVGDVANWKDRYALDLFEKMPYHSLSAVDRKELWDDGLHFTPKGYEMIGNLVAVRMIEIIRTKFEAEG